MFYIQVALGFILLLGGAEFLVRGAVALARRFGVSPILIGMTIVAFGTSAPEFVVSVQAAMSGAGSLALGNIVGSNIANVLLILGVSGLVRPIAMKGILLLRDGSLLIGGSLLVAVLLWLDAITFWSGVAMLGIYLGFLVFSYWQETAGGNGTAELYVKEVEEFHNLPKTLWGMWGAVLAGMFGVGYGADLLVDGGTGIARSYGVSEEVIGLTMIAVGTSLPELVTSMVAAMRRHTDVAIGNVVGSNVINILGVTGVAAIFAPIPVPAQIVGFDLWVMLASTVLLAAFLVGGWRFGRGHAVLFLGAYILYLAVQATGAPILITP